MPNDGSMDAYVAARSNEAAPAAEAPSTATPAAPAQAPAQDPATSGAADPASAAPSPDESGAAPVTETPQQQQQRTRRNRAQERFNELTRSNAEKDRQIALLVEGQRTLLTRFSQPAGEQPQPTQQRPNGQPLQHPPNDPPPREEDFPGDYRAFLREDARWASRQETRQENQRQSDARAEQERTRSDEAKAQEHLQQVGRVVNDFAARNDEQRAMTPDYDSVTESLDDFAIGPHNAAMVQTILLRRDSANVLYHLGKNPQVVDHISRLPAALQGAAVGEFAASLRHAPQPSPAPSPGRPVSSRAPSGPSTIVVNGSMDDYAASRNRMQRTQS